MKDKFPFATGTSSSSGGRFLTKREGNAPTTSDQSSKAAIDKAKEQLVDTAKRYTTARHGIVVKRYAGK